ncbi:phosphotransferase family protein [Sphingomonas sp.]|uniref:phosphotransferase family protein n=1 Tax=Sphingomonas sp. TaxID=28214 RepID=UPI002DD6B2C3|nr:phosphotransferase family protein [Sphingomonas sp.]
MPADGLRFAEDWRALVDLDRLRAWMDDRGLGDGPIVAPQPLAGGTQNLLLRFDRRADSFVLRRPSGKPRTGADEAMRREARILEALGASDVPHPRLLAACGHSDVIGAPFYLMQAVEGFNPSLGLPSPFADDPALRHRMGLALVDGAATLARFDAAASGLSDLGRGEGFLQRQVGRWLRQLASYAECEGWPGPRVLPGVEDVAARLTATLPPDAPLGLMHGDYHMANVLFHRDRPELAAIVDWELATIGDPLVDLGWILATWPDRDGLQMGSVTPIQPWSGFPDRDALIARYAETSGRDVRHIDWYERFARFKLGIMLEGTHARALGGRADPATGRRLHAKAVALLAAAHGDAA